jgi:hypothetical protein
MVWYIIKPRDNLPLPYQPYAGVLVTDGIVMLRGVFGPDSKRGMEKTT